MMLSWIWLHVNSVRRHFLIIILAILVLAWVIFEEVQNRRPFEVSADLTPVIVEGGPTQDGIPSIDDPQFESMRAADTHLSDEGLGLDVELNGQHRFYPFQILTWHEVVNESFDGTDLLVTFSPLTYTATVYERDDAFGVSGKLFNNNLLMYDRTTNTLWSQLTGEAIQGSLEGTQLERYPSQVMSWAAWKRTYPYGSVLSRETGYERDYTNDPYFEYYTSDEIWFPLANLDDRLPPKTLVAPEEGLVTYWFAWVAFYPESSLLEPITF